MTNAANVRILLVDDSEIVRESVKYCLERAGFTVLALGSPFGFIKTIRDFDPAVILLDIGLGTSDGTKLVGLGRRHASPKTRILLFSGREDVLLSQDAKSSGADGCVSKNNVGNELVEAVQRFIRA